MHRTPVFPAFAAALAALAAGCEWTGTSSSDSWSGSYDAMNFSGTYRSAATLESGSTEGGASTTIRETVGNYQKDNFHYSGNLSHTPVDVSSVQIQFGGITFTGDSAGNLISDYGSGKVTTSGAWSIDVTKSSSSSTTGSETVKDKVIGHVESGDVGFPDGSLLNTDIVSGTVQITVGEVSFTDPDGDGKLVGSLPGFSGGVVYKTGSFHLDWPEKKDFIQTKTPVKASFSYDHTKSDAGSGQSPLSGSGKIVAVYTTTGNGTSSSLSVTSSNSEITAITVSQSGQNLSMSTNTGIVMSGRFTAVRETKAASDSGVATYNAQFQVTSAAGHKFVGALNYDIATGHRTVNGTLTAGNATYDVQGVGPAF